MEQSLESFSTWFRELYHLDKPDVREYSALTLAYIGDAVYEIIIRSYIVGKGNAPVERLHKRSSRLVKNATMSDYRKATGCEALVGYLYLTERYERLTELIHTGLKALALID